MCVSKRTQLICTLTLLRKVAQLGYESKQVQTAHLTLLKKRKKIVFFSSHSTRLLAATTLRNVLGTKNLAEILSERESISHVMQSSLDDATDPWGVKVERVEM